MPPSTCGDRDRAGDEHEAHRHAGRDPGLGVGHHDEDVDVPPRRTEVARSLDLVAVQAFDRVVEREDHDQEVRVTQGHVERGVGPEKVHRRVDNPYSEEQRVQEAAVGEHDPEREGPQHVVHPVGNDENQ